MKNCMFVCIGVWWLGLLPVASPMLRGAEPVEAIVKNSMVQFARDIQPLFRRHCYRCHGPSKQEGGFSLSDRAAALGVGDSQLPLVIAGNVEASLLYQRIAGDTHGDTMPLDAQALSEPEISLIHKWISQGASWPVQAANKRHWAYIRPHRSGLPEVEAESWPQNPIDHFVLHRLEQEGLAVSEESHPARLVRRLSLVLTGLPPTIEQVDRYVNDPSPDAYERLVDELLASKGYGERWAQQWLDLARYADSNGFQADQLRDSWAYRDWVIRAFNQDMPFDQFTVEQIAGDLLPNASADQKIATGFHRTTTCNVEAGVHPEENRVNQVFDRVNTTGTVFLGTTLECCQCHDHKYDPFTSKDYYSLFACFNNTPLEVDLTSGVTYDFVGPKMDLPLASNEQRTIDDLRAKIELLTAKRRKLNDELSPAFEAWQERITFAVRESAPRWHAANIDSFTASGGETGRVLEDGSTLVEGPVPDTTVYELSIPGRLPDVTAIKLETLTDPTLPGKGPGRGSTGKPNFILSELTLSVKRPGDASNLLQTVELNDPVADFSQKGWNIDGAIDGDPKTGWGINPQFGKPHWATFSTKTPVDLGEGDKLHVRLEQLYGGGRTIGRLRVSLLTGSAEVERLPAELLALFKKNQADTNADEKEKLRSFFAKSDPMAVTIDRQLTGLQNQLDRIRPPTTLVMVEMEQPRESFVFQRGNYLSPGKKVGFGTPKILHPFDSALPGNRLGLARWLVSRENPLLARVTVNRWWSEFFGKGIVATAEDFGTQCEPPTHPELLDWLAVEFMESGWSMKHIHRLIALSATFRQSARVDGEQLRLDPENKLYARGPRFRLAAECIRDNALAVSGLLSRKMFGPPVMPYQPDGLWKSIGRNQPKWVTATNEDRFRRGVYVIWKRDAPYPSFINFDAPDRTACAVKRGKTNTPLQALTLLNDPAYAEMALAFARQIMTQSGETDLNSRINWGFRQCLAREPTKAELEILAKLFEQELSQLHKNPKLVKARLQNSLPGKWQDGLDKTELAAWFAIANTLLNLDETVNL